MKPWALVPVKRFDQGKSRLGAVLSPEERTALSRAMFERVVSRVLGGLSASGEIAGTLVVTDDQGVAERAHEVGAEAMVSAGVGPTRRLGAIVDEGLAALRARGATAAVVIMGDLPALEAEDVRAMSAILGGADVVLAPDDAGSGTNALAMRLPAPMPTRFRGGESLMAHLVEAKARGLQVALCQRPGLGFDVDQPEDVARLSAQGKTSRAWPQPKPGE